MLIRLLAYSAGNGPTATGDATYATDIPDNAGIALFNNNTVHRKITYWQIALTLSAQPRKQIRLYKEGTGYTCVDAFFDRLCVCIAMSAAKADPLLRWGHATISDAQGHR